MNQSDHKFHHFAMQTMKEKMDIVQVKENIPQSADIEFAGVVHPNKMVLSSTPRLPLADFKQAARPCSNQKRKSRSSFPLLTPNGKKATRKSQPVTLVYQEDKENEIIQSDGVVDDEPQFCTKQLDNKYEPVIQNTPRLNVDPSQLVDNERICNEVQNIERAAIDSSIIAEEFLLGDSPNISTCSDNFYDSSKSEEELLAQTPVVESGTAAERGATELYNRNVDMLKDAVFKVKTPKVNFLEQAGLTERVKKATHSIGNFVMHKENMLPELKLTWTEGGRATLVQKSVDTGHIAHESEVFNKSMNTEAFTPEGKASHSVACSPLPMMQQDVGTQNGVEINSVLCSPIPIPRHDVSTQNETETQSILCSPIRFPQTDTSSQAVVETRSVMCTPMRIPVRDSSTQNVTKTQSSSCSPMVIAVAEVSTQNEVETQSVLCSPMVPCPSVDKSVLVSGPELVDLCIGTDIVETRDEEVSVQPETSTISTSMEDFPMVSCGTIMTPLKVAHKQRKRMTADDVRKQHPRVLANELDTLRTQNERLEGRVLSLQQDVKKLASFEEVLTDLEDARSMLEKERDLYWKEYGEWKSKCELLETENETLKTAHSQEITDMKERYESCDYYSHFLSSQKLVGELQVELDEYKELLPELEQSQKLLNDLKTQYSRSFSKLKQANEKLTQRKVELIEKEAEITNLKSVCNKIAEGNMNIEKERGEMAETISALRSRIAKLEEEVKTKDEALRKLDESTECVKTQANAIINLEHTVDHYEKEIDMLEMDLFECREVICNQMEERNGFESREKLQTKELKSLTHENNGLKLEEEVKTKDEALRKLDESTECVKTQANAIINLEHTVDDYEKEIDMLEMDLFECREVICNQMEERNGFESREKLQTKELKSLTHENNGLKLEEEVKTKDEALRKLDESTECVKTQANAIINLEHTVDDYEKEIDMLEMDLFECREVICNQMEERNGFESREKLQTKELKSLTHENNGLKDCLARLRAQEQEAKDGWTMVQEELNGTKEHASRIIKQQGTEIAECSSSIGQLLDHMTSVLAYLKKRAGFEDEDCCIEESQTTKKSSKPLSMPLPEIEPMPEIRPVPTKKFAPKKSFVSQILQAVQRSDPETSSAPDQVTGKDEDSENKTTYKTTSGNEELLPVSDNLGQTVNQSDGNAATLGTENVVHRGSSNGNNLDVSSYSAFVQVKSSDESQNQSEACQLDKDDKNVMRRNNQVLKKKTNIVDSFRDAKTPFLHTVSKCQEKGSEPSGVIEVENKLSDQLRKMTEMFKQVMHVTSLIEKALRSSLQDMRSKDYELRGKVFQCEYSEKRAWSQLGIVQSELETSRKLVKQKQTLIDEQYEWLEGMLETQSVAEVDKYRLSMLDKQELIWSERIKANERILKMEDNWKKANAEVMRLNDRIDRVRSTLVVSKNFPEDPDLQKVMEVIDGLEKDTGRLFKLMKTSRW